MAKKAKPPVFDAFDTISMGGNTQRWGISPTVNPEEASSDTTNNNIARGEDELIPVSSNDVDLWSQRVPSVTDSRNIPIAPMDSDLWAKRLPGSINDTAPTSFEDRADVANNQAFYHQYLPKHLQTLSDAASDAYWSGIANEQKFFGDPFGTADKIHADVERNQRLRENRVHLGDDPIKYITDPNGLAASTGELVGSAGSMLASTLATAAALKALGVVAPVVAPEITTALTYGGARMAGAKAALGSKLSNAASKIPGVTALKNSKLGQYITAGASSPVAGAAGDMISKYELLKTVPESAMEGGGKIYDLQEERDKKKNNYTDEEIRDKANEVFAKNMALLGITNQLEGAMTKRMLGSAIGANRATPGLLNAGLKKVGLDIAKGGIRGAIGAGVKSGIAATGNAGNESFLQENLQTAIENSVDPGKAYTYNPLKPFYDDRYMEQRNSALDSFLPTLMMGGLGTPASMYHGYKGVDSNFVAEDAPKQEAPKSEQDIAAETAQEIMNGIPEETPVEKPKRKTAKAEVQEQPMETTEETPTEKPKNNLPAVWAGFAETVRDTAREPENIVTAYSMFDSKGEFVPSEENIKTLANGVVTNDELKQLYASYLRYRQNDSAKGLPAPKQETVKQETQKETPRAAVQNTQGISNFTKAKMFYLNDGEMRRNLIAYAQTNGIGLSRKERSNIMKGEDKAVGKLLAKLQNKGVNLYAPDNRTETPNQSETSQSQSAENLNENTKPRQTAEEAKVDDRKGSITKGLQEVSEYDDDGNVNPDVVSFLETASRQLTEGDGKAVSVVSSFIPEDIRRPVTQAIQRGELELAKEYIDEKLEELGGKPFAVDKSNEMDDTVEGTSVDDVDTPIGRNIKKFERHGIKLKTNETVEKYLKTLPEEIRKKAFRLLYQKQDLIGVSDGTPITAGMTVADAIKVAVENPNLFSIKRYYNRDGRGISGHFLYNLTNKERVRLTAIEYNYADYLKGSIKKSNKGVDKKNKQASGTAEDAASNETPTKEVPKDTSKQENEKNITAKMRGSEKQIKIATDIINGMCDTFRNHADEFEGDAADSIVDSINSAAEADVYAGDIIGKFKNRPTTDAEALFDKIVSASMPDEHNAFAIEIMHNLLRKHPELRETYTWIKDDTSSATAASDNNNAQPKEQKTEKKVSANMFDNVINDKAVKDTATAAAKGNKAAQKAVDIAKKLPTAKEEKKATTTKAENKSDKVDLSGAFGNINDVDNDLASLADDLVGMGFNVGDKKPARPKVAKKLLNVVDDSDEALEKLIEEFTSITNKVSSNPVFNPELYVKALNIGMVYVQRGVNRFSDWANLMGKIDGMQDWINAIWDSINSYPEGEKFSPAVMTKLTKAVGTLYTNNITDLDAIQERIFNNLRIPAIQQKRFAPIIESAYNGVKTFVDGQEVNANGQERRESESTQERPVDMEQAEVSDAEKERGHSGVSGEVPRRSGREGEGNTRTAQTGDTAGEDGTGRVREGAELEETASEGDSAGGNKQSAPKLTPAQKNPSPEETPGHDYEIKKSITKKSEADRFKQNVAALKLLHELEVQGRMPTPKEQEILAGYNGCGGIKSAFVDGTKENKEMRELVSSGVITEEEYKSMRSTVNDAFYTSPDLVRAIWKGVSHLGFNGGRILDPAMGTGNFFGCMPRDMMKKSSLHGVELDSLSSRFAKYLYPSAMVKNSPFQNADSPNNFFDLVITNVPFSSVTVDGYQVHNYYFANGIDKVRPGGLMVYITSQGSLNGSTDAAKMRSYLASKADMVAAFKLPEDTFTDAGAKVTTDVVIFRKRDNDGQKYKGAQNFLDVAYNRGGYGANINQYFLDNPSAVLGKLVNSRGQFGWEYSVKRNEAANTAEELEKAMRKLPKDVYKPVTRTGKKTFNSHEANKRARADEKTRDGELYIDKSGKPVQNEAGEAKPISGKNAPMVKAYIELKNTLKSLYQAQRDPNASDNVINAIRSNLNKQYDAFVKKYGHLNEEQVSKVVLSDPSAGMMMSLERFDTRKEKRGNRKVDVFSNWSKADIFTKRTVQAVRDVKTASSPSDALIASLGNKGYVDVDYMAELLGTTPEQIAEQLSGQIFKNPSTGAYESREEYLSGNVKEKLAQAQAASKTDKAYERNVKELEAVIPADLVAEEIGVKLGSPWIPTPDIQEFVTFASGSRNLMVERLSQFGKWTVTGWGSPAKYKVEGIEFKNMLENVLNNKSVEIYDIVGRGKDAHKVLNQSKTDAANVVADKLKADFVTWLWSDKARKDRLVKFYNDNFNNEVLRKYDGSHLTFPGMNASITLRQHQKDVIWRMMQGVNTLIAHCVGAGKTFEMQAAGMEMRRLGIAQKPMYCLPNNVVEQFAREFRLLYPEAKLLVLDSSHLPSNIRTTKVEVTEDGRKVKTKLKLSERDKSRLPAVRAQRARTLSKIQSEDWDAVIISHNLFERFEVSPETRAEYIQEELDTLEQAISESKGGKIGDKRTLSNMEKKLASLKEALEEALSTPKEDIGITFEELGVDQLFVDEADLFKNLRTPSFLERMSGINTSSDAKRSRDMHMKTRWLTRMNGGRGVVFATGTPISNSLVEQYTMLRYLDEQGLNEKGMGFFDNWANAFCNFALDIERKPTGDGYRKVIRVTKFINQAEMKKMFRKVADVKTQEELVEAGLIKIPKLKNGKPTAIVLPVDEQVRRYIKEEVPARIAKMKKGFDKEKGDDNMLALMGDLRKLSMTDKKIAACADMVAETFFDTGDVKGTQLVFCDMGIPRAEKDTESTTDKEGAEVTEDKEDSSIYEKLINYLVDRGVPREQIAFAQQAKNKDELDAIFQKVDKGEIRILIGSTSKMGAGTNCQHHLVALHDLDAPWRPRDLDQRHGRIMRSGNQNAEVEIFNYILKDSFDAVMWEKLKNKEEVIAQAMNGDMSIRELDDTGLATLTYSEMENEATGNPLIKEQLKLEGEIKKQKNALQNFKRQQHEAEKQLESVLPLRVQENELEHRRIEEDIKNRKDTSGENFSMTIDGKTFTSRTEAQEALDAILSKTVSYTPVEIGSIGGLKVKAAKVNGYAVNGDSVNDFKLTLNGNIEYNVNGATIRSIEAALKSAPDKALENNVRSGEIIHRLLQEAKDTVALEDNYSEKLRELEERLKVVQKQIEEELVDGGKKPQQEVQENSEDTDYSASEEEDFDTPTVTIDELKENLDSFNLSHKQLGKDTIQVTLPNGEKLFVHVSEHDSLPLTEAEEKKARKAHGLAEGTPIKVNGSLKGNLITLARKGDKGTIYHELFHFAEKFLTKEERDFLSGLIGNKEKRADAFRDFINGKKFSGRLGKVFDTIRHACDVILAKIGVKASQKRLIFDKVSSGEVFKRTAESPVDEIQYAADNKGKRDPSPKYVSDSVVVLKPNEQTALWGDEPTTGYLHAAFTSINNMLKKMPLSALDDTNQLFTRLVVDDQAAVRSDLNLMQILRQDGKLVTYNQFREDAIRRQMSIEAKKEVFSNVAYRRGLARLIEKRSDEAGIGSNRVRQLVAEYSGEVQDGGGQRLSDSVGLEINSEYRIPESDAYTDVTNEAKNRLATTAEDERNGRGVQFTGIFGNIDRANRPNFIDNETRFSVSESHSEKGGFSNGKIKAGTFFSGAGLVDYALRDVIDGQFAVEKDSAIAEAYALNHNGEVMFNGDVRDFKVGKHKGNVDYFHASPVCKNYSMAKRNVAFDEQVADNKVDITTAKATADAIRELQPKVFTLEQVKAYQGSKALKIITKTLDELGYHWDGNVYNAADYGAGTSRERFLLRAVKDGQLPSLPPKVDKKTGWLEAMEEAGVTLDSLPERPYDKDSEVYKAVKNTFPKNPDKPVLIQGRRFGESKVRYSPADEPAPAITASDHEYRILTPDGKFLDASPRVIAAISGLDKSFKLPKNKQLGYTVVGNGVPVKLTQAIFGNLLNDTLVNPVESDGMYFDAEGEGTLFGGDDTDYSISEVKEAKKDSDNILSRAMKSLKEKMSKDKNPEIQILAKQIDPNHIGLTDEWLTSPSRIAEKFKAFRQFFIFADNAMGKLQKLRGLWNRRLDIALGYSKNKLSNEERSDLFKLLFMGDAEGKEYTAEEISMLGYGDNVTKAYKRVRILMDTIYKALNDARTRVQTKTKTMTSDSLSDLLNTEVSKKMLAEDDAVSKLNNNKQNNFVEILRITENEDGKYTVSYKEKPNWKHKYEAIAETALNKMAKDPAMNTGVAKEVGIDPDTGERLYDVEVWETIPDIRKLSGYIPHFFHEYMIRYKNIDKNGKEFYEVIGSGNTLKDAKKAADKWLEENPDAEASNVVIAPKSFDFIGQLGMNMANGVVIGDKDYFKMMQKVANQNDMTLAEAKDVLSGAVKQKNRHRFLGNFLHRKGAKGYDDNMEWVLRHYVNTSARYIALETEFKPQAISLYERVFGAFDNARNHTGLGGYAYDYINDVNGNPSEFEKKLNNILNGDGWVGKIWQSAIKGLNWMGGDWGDRAALELSNKITGLVAISKLGFFNISSALVNFTQLANSAAYIGDVSALMKAMAKGARRKYSVRDMRILVDSGVLFDIGLESASGYNNTTVSGKVGKLLSKSMVFFQTSEGIVRRGTILAAYDKGREKGMTHDEAIAYAQEINRKANFEYGVHDAPNMFRRTGVLGQFLFQFKKYAIKEWEVMSDMMPLFSNKTSAKQKAIFWGYYFLLSGLFQIPFFDAFDDLFFGGKLKRNAKKCIMEVTAGNKALEPLAKVAMYGIGAVANADISRRVGQGDILPTSASDLLGPTGSTIAQMWKYGTSNPIASLRAFSPGLANIVQAGMGYSVGKRGRKLQEYNSYYDKALKAIGIRSVDESIASDTEDIVKAERREKRDKDSALIDDYIKAREDNDSKKMGEYAREMKARGIKKERVLNEIENKKLDKKSRTRKGLNKKEQREYRNLFKFGQ